MQSPAGARLFVKRVICHRCGGPKLSVPRTGYVYCDFCGALTDWDFQVALSRGSAPPGPAYEALRAMLGPELKMAKQRGDQRTYADLQRRLWTQYVDACPAALSPRIADPTYRFHFIEFMVRNTTAQDFDAYAAALGVAMEVATRQLVWDRRNPGQPKAQSASFWQLYATVKARLEATTKLMVDAGIADLHPDRAPAELHLRMAWSLFAQGWIPFLAAEDAERLLTETRLKGDYVNVPAPLTTAVRCGGCGTVKPAPLGASRTVCEGCGRVTELGAASLPCPQCGAPMTFPAGAKAAQCGHCRLDVRAMRH